MATTTPGRAIWLNAAEYQEFESFTFESVNPERTLGLPVERLELDGGRRSVRFTTGATYQEAADGPAHVRDGRDVRRVATTGGLDGSLGEPLTNDYFIGGDPIDSGIAQEFRNGRLFHGYVKGSSYEFIAYGSDLLDPPTFDGPTVVRAMHDSGAWLIDGDGRRSIPWSSFDCIVETRDLPVVDDVHMAAILSLDVGEPVAPCR